MVGVGLCVGGLWLAVCGGVCFFFFNDTATTEIYTLSLHDALPISARDDYQGSLGVFLDANESPYDTGYNRYPDPHQKDLKAKISKIKGLPAENIFIGRS